MSDCSGKFLRKVLDANCCRINGNVERFGSRQILRGDFVELSPQWETIGTKLTFDVLYEDETLKIINKPAGWVCDPKNVEKGLYLVHRLDKETTGALILAKGTKSRDELFELFEKRQIHKTYLTVVDGIPRQEGGEIQSLFCKKGAFQGQTIWGSGISGLTAITKWQKLKTGKDASLIQCEPFTGRTHQIRVHMAEMGHPILVDRQYAKSYRCQKFASRVMLHASHLQFGSIDVKAPLFVDMQNFLRDVGIDL